MHNINLKNIPGGKVVRRAIHAFKKSRSIGSDCDVKRDADNNDQLFSVPNQKNNRGAFGAEDLGVTLEDVLNGDF